MVLGVAAVPGAPDTLLCHPTHRTAQILAYAILPACVGLFVHILQTVADFSLALQLWKAEQPVWASITFGLILAPPIFGAILTLSQPDDWPGTSMENCRHLCLHGIYYVLLFPLAAVHRYCRRIFWSMEALYVEDKGLERTKCLRRATETSPLELFHFLQAYIQGVIQCLFQIWLVLEDNTFRDYDIVKLQLVTIFAALLRLSMTSALYQRFHSQKIAGRHYPWDRALPGEELDGNDIKAEEPSNIILLSHKQLSEEALLPENLKTLEEQDLVLKKNMKIPSDNFLNNLDECKKVEWDIQKNFRLSSDGNIMDTSDTSDFEVINMSHPDYVNLADCDTGLPNGPPMTTAPKKPVDDVPYSVLVRLSTVRDQLRYSAGVMLDDLLGRRDSMDYPPAPTRALPPPPTGLKRDDAISYTVCTIGWFFYLSSRFLAIGTTLTFYPYVTCIIVSVTYLLICSYFIYLSIKINDYRKGYFSLFLGYLYIFVMLELKFKFYSPRKWFGYYFLFATAQSWGMAFAWYWFADWNSWWFEYSMGVILGGTALAILCAGLYFAILKPREQIVIK